MCAKLNYPAHLEIARKGTPLQKMERLSEELEVEVFFKRDDLTGSVNSPVTKSESLSFYWRMRKPTELTR